MSFSSLLESRIQEFSESLQPHLEFKTHSEGEQRRLALELKQETTDLLRRLVEVARDKSYLDPAAAATRAFDESVRTFARNRAQQGFTATETARYVFTLKDLLFSALLSRQTNGGESFPEDFGPFLKFIDRASIQLFEIFATAREDIIRRQSRTITELSTPAIKLWEGVLLLPIVGILDTTRASELMERLLESIVKTESRVAILDITGVPVIDTKVAHYLLKTVAAAKMLGAETILTGISPNAAQALVKLGVDLRSTCTRGTLRSGVAEALARMNLVVSARKEQK